ncbi:rubredoxin [Solemya pervernicosa gill symbiont]|uniref:Rubredoxin n=2 Tax=Gammaproteobacteria incertae sedis TaxID=118884 RepID=A0A1T2L3V2_9GAMM|nr:rubredoxin [Solemya pervernicosa gill symbiont]
MHLCLTPQPIYGEALMRYMCDVCGLIYDEEKGLPDEGIAPGTRLEDIPDDWVCPDCGATKESFVPDV